MQKKFDREKMVQVVEDYKRYMRAKDIDNVLKLFSDKPYFHVFNSNQHAENKEELKKIYMAFTQFKDVQLDYSNYTFDDVNNSLAFSISYKGKDAEGTVFNIQTCLLIQLDENYKIDRVLDWYGYITKPKAEYLNSDLGAKT